jgi:hypothetical protein
VVKEFFFNGVAVEPGDGAQAAGDGGPGPAAGFQVPGEELDVGPAGIEQVQLVMLAPTRELPQIQLIGLAGQTALPGQEPRQGQPLSVGEDRREGDEGGGQDRGGHEAPPGTQAETPMPGQPRPQQTTRTPP